MFWDALYVLQVSKEDSYAKINTTAGGGVNVFILIEIFQFFSKRTKMVPFLFLPFVVEFRHTVGQEVPMHVGIIMSLCTAKASNMHFSLYLSVDIHLKDHIFFLFLFLLGVYFH